MEYSPGQITSWATSQALVKLKKLKSGIFSDHNVMRLEIKHRQITVKKNKTYEHMEAKQYITKQPMITEEIKEEIKKYLQINENKNATI